MAIKPAAPPKLTYLSSRRRQAQLSAFKLAQHLNNHGDLKCRSSAISEAAQDLGIEPSPQTIAFARARLGRMIAVHGVGQPLPDFGPAAAAKSHRKASA